MMHELYQNPLLGAINPAAAINPLAASLGMFANSPAVGINPQQFLHLTALAQAAQAAQLLGPQNPIQAALQHQQLLAQASLQNPFVQQQIPFIQQNPFAQQNPFVQQQNPYLQQQNPYLQQNPLMQQTPFLNPILAQQYGALLGLGTPYGQINPALAPQSWVGQGGQLGGQLNPLVQHLVARQLHNPVGQWTGI